MTEAMTCGAVRRLLWPDGSPRLATEALLLAEAHLAGCGECRQFLTDMNAMADRFRRAAPLVEAPADLRHRLFSAVARARIAASTPAPGRGRRWLAALAGVAALGALVLGYQRWVRQDRTSAITMFAEDHRRAAKGEGIATSDSLTASRWLAVRLPIAVPVPLFPGATLKGARLWVMGEERGAVLQYELDGRMLSYYVVPARQPHGVAGSGPELRFAAKGGYRVVMWQDAGLTHALAADLSQSHLADLAQYCIHQMTVALAHLADTLRSFAWGTVTAISLAARTGQPGSCGLCQRNVRYTPLEGSPVKRCPCGKRQAASLLDASASVSGSLGVKNSESGGVSRGA